MKFTSLGHSGLRVSELCLGTMTFGREADEAQSHAILDAFVEKGGNFIDTADIYTDGASERIIGNWIGGKNREDLVIATKVRFSANRDPNRIGLSRKRIMAAVDDSLKNLKTDYIDLYQTHLWDNVTPIEETLEALNDLVRAGKVRYLGASNVTGAQLQKSVDLQDANGWARYISLQPLYNLLDRAIEWELIDVCLDEGIGIIPWSPLRGGWLTGKFHRGMAEAPSGTRIEQADKHGWSEGWSHYANEQTWTIIDKLQLIAKDKKASVAQIALAWVLAQPGITSPILGARNLKQLEDNMGASDIELSEEEIGELTEASNKPLPYPYDHITRERLPE